MSQNRSFYFATFQKTILTFGVLALLFNFSCSSKSKKKIPGVGDKVYPVSAFKVFKEEVPDIVEMKGTFIPSDKLDVKAETEGKVLSSPVSEGQMVAFADPLASINPEQLHLLLEKEKLELKEQEAKIEAGLSMKNVMAKVPFGKALGAQTGPDVGMPPNPDQNPNNPNPTSPDQVGEELPAPESVPDKPDNSDAIVRANEVTLGRIKAEIALTEKKIESANVTTGISGLLSKKNITDGSVVTLGEVLFQVVKIDPILLSVFVSKKEIGNIQKGEKVDVKTEEIPNASLNGEVVFVAAEADPQNKNNYEVRVSVPNTQLKIKAGMTGLAIMPQTGIRKAILIPEDAMVTINNKKYVYVVQGQIAEGKEVELGDKIGNKIEVKSGLKEGEEVVMKGQVTFKDEQEFVKVE